MSAGYCIMSAHSIQTLLATASNPRALSSRCLAPTPQRGCTGNGLAIGQASLQAAERTSVISAAVAAPPAPSAAAPSSHSNGADLTGLYKRLQNGSDVRGVAIAGVQGEPQTLTADNGFFLGAALAETLSERVGKPASSLRISIGSDPRLTGPLLRSALAAGIVSKGASVADFGLATTPAMFMSCILPGHDYDGGVIITASHLPYNRNGFKFFTKDGGFDKTDISKLLDKSAQLHSSAHAPLPDSSGRYLDASYVLQQALAVDGTKVESVDFMPVYHEHLRNIIKKGVDHPKHYDTPLKGFHIVLDAGNGGGGFLATHVLEPLGANIDGSQFLDPDGWFPNHSPNPEDRSAMTACVRAVNRAEADLGIVVDTDVDRSAVVGSNGAPISSNRYIALMASIALRKYPGTTVVTDSVTSNGLADFIKELGGKHYRYRRGYKNIITKGLELNNQGRQTELVMETSGHGAMKENYFLDDGTYSASQIIIEMVKRKIEGKGDVTTDLLDQLKEPAESREFRLKLKGKNFSQVGQEVLQRFHSWVTAGKGGEEWALEAENHEGWRVSVDEGNGQQGWLLLRASLHDPLLVLNAESELVGGTCETVQRVLDFFESEALPDFDIDLDNLYDGASQCTLKYL